MRNWLRNFMMGRYGNDQLNSALSIVSLVFLFVSMISGLGIIYYLALALLILSIIRSFSKNIYARRRENDRFLAVWRPIKHKFRIFFRKLKDRKHYRFYRCPGCKNTLRVPKGKGRIQVTCPRCGERFIKKS